MSKKEIPDEEYAKLYKTLGASVGSSGRVGLRAQDLWEKSYPNLTPGQALREALKEFESFIREA